MEKPIWSPDTEAVSQTNAARFIAWLRANGHDSVTDFVSLHAFSVQQPDAFWSAVWSYCDVVGVPGDRAFVPATDSDLRTARFFPDAEISYAENVLARLPEGDAIVFRGEDKVARRLSSDEVRRQTACFAAMLADAGCAAGDRVAAMLPNVPEGVIGLLGTNARAAVWSSCSPDFGTQGVLDRFGQIAPKAFVVCDGYYYNGKTIDVGDKVAEIVRDLPSCTHIVVVDYIGQADAVVDRLRGVLQQDGRSATVATWASAVSARAETEPTCVRQAFNAPIYILFSSGTTGKPKCIVHANGGVLLKHLTEHLFHSDVRPGDHVFYFTTLGWMMWNWLVTGLGCGARLMLFDGSPFYPDGTALWRYAEEERFTHFGTSAKYIDALNKSGVRPGEAADLSALRAVLSTGSPLVPEAFDYVYDAIKSDVHLASISGGTDIVGCFILGDPLSPVYRGEIQSAALGLATDVAAPDGSHVASGKGELVCRSAFPSMPVGFWDDDDGVRYRAAYFDRFPGIWHHGDFAEWTDNGGMIIHGRSDATLNPGGVRIGTAEIYRQVEQLPEIIESIVIGQQWEGDVRVVLFVRLAAGATLDGDLEQRIKLQIRHGASPRHVPARIVVVDDIPRTKSGKITELAVRDIVHGREIANTEALANPEALAHFANRAELQS
ncbi:MAG: acetoacetate--CoA ligase [Pseudomonadota bacterium]